MFLDEIVTIIGKKIETSFTQTDIVNIGPNIGDPTFLNLLKESQKFAFTEDSAEMIYQINNCSPKSLLDVIDTVELPFDNIWVEWSYPQSQRALIEIETYKYKDRIFPYLDKIGFWLTKTCVDGSFHMFMFLKDKNISRPHSIGMCRIAIKLEKISDGREILSKKEFIAIQKNMSPYIAERYKNMSTDEIEALQIILSRMSFCVSPFHKDNVDNIILDAKDHGYNEETIQRIMRIDWNGRQLLPAIALTILNLKNAIQINDAVIDPALKKARYKRGKLPLFEHKILDISEDMKERKRTMSTNCGTKQRFHWVRGHFKLRKSGTFWWSGHTAGDNELGIITKDYIV